MTDVALALSSGAALVVAFLAAAVRGLATRLRELEQRVARLEGQRRGGD